MRCFPIHDESYHLQCPLPPLANTSPAFAQLYLYDPTYATQERHSAHTNLNSNILLHLTNVLHEVNPYSQIHKTATERLEESVQSENAVRIILNPHLGLIIETGADRRRENLPISKILY